MSNHKQVQYNNIMVDEKILPIVKMLNDNGVETLFSCQGDDDSLPYVVIKNSSKTEIFVKTLLMLDFMCRESKMHQENNDTHIASNFQTEFDCELGEYRYCIRCRSLQTMESMISATFECMNTQKL